MEQRVHELGLSARFRYNDLKEAAVIATQRAGRKGCYATAIERINRQWRIGPGKLGNR
jgi:hypothetical protein